ncbi:MAG TPA: acetolactate synthase [Opitutus sp.]|nr:acetolactate synthase [Opitutus sp.]
MSASSTAIARDPVKQFSVFAENRVGRLNDLVALFRHHNVHIMAITVLDTTDSAIVRLIVDDPDKARELMVNNDFPYTECEVVAVEIGDESKLRSVLAALLEAEINVHYVYSFIKRPEGGAALAMSVEDPDVAIQALARTGFKLLTQRDISR